MADEDDTKEQRLDLVGRRVEHERLLLKIERVERNAQASTTSLQGAVDALMCKIEHIDASLEEFLARVEAQVADVEERFFELQSKNLHDSRIEEQNRPPKRQQAYCAEQKPKRTRRSQSLPK